MCLWERKELLKEMIIARSQEGKLVSESGRKINIVKDTDWSVHRGKFKAFLKKCDEATRTALEAMIIEKEEQNIEETN